jgi:hypothetical protein
MQILSVQNYSSKNGADPKPCAAYVNPASGFLSDDTDIMESLAELWGWTSDLVLLPLVADLSLSSSPLCFVFTDRFLMLDSLMNSVVIQAVLGFALLSLEVSESLSLLFDVFSRELITLIPTNLA